MNRETAWLIERAGKTGQPHWWDGIGWNACASNGVRFSRQSDAEKVIAFMEDSLAVATEHIWDSGTDEVVR